MSDQTAVTADPSSSSTTTTADPSTTAQTTTLPATQTTDPVFTYKEKRDDWVSPEKFRSIERATNLAAQRANQLEQELASERRRVQALAGVTPQDPNEADEAKIMEAFEKIAPWAKAFRGMTPDQIADALSAAGSGRDAERVIWDKQRDATLADLHSRVAESLGVEKVSATQAQKISALFKASVPDIRTDPEGHEAFRQRYEAGDKTLLDEFVKSFADDFITPAPRANSAQIMARRRQVPSGGYSQPMTTAQPKLKPGNLDAAIDRAAAILEERGMFKRA